MTKNVHTLIIGGGQAGLSLSYYLSQAGHEHLVLEKAAQPAEAWRNQRWDSFTLVTPNWTLLLPGGEYLGDAPDAFMPRAEIVQGFEKYIGEHRLPIQFSTQMTEVKSLESGGRFCVETSVGRFHAQNVVVATGLFQQDRIPAWAAQLPPEIAQIGASQYRNPSRLPAGAVLVVGSGQTGCQIAEELAESGRRVFLSTGTTGSLPRRYRGKDIFYWADVTGFLARTTEMLPSPAARFSGNPQLTGKNGGHDLNIHLLYRKGIVLLGKLRGWEDKRLAFAPDLRENVVKADQLRPMFLKQVDDYVSLNGLSAPEEEISAPRDAYQAAETLYLEPSIEKIAVIVWTMGFRFDFSMVRDAKLDSFGYPVTDRGLTQVPGLHFHGLPWLNTQKSGLIMGVGADAARLAEQITQGNTGAGRRLPAQRT